MITFRSKEGILILSGGFTIHNLGNPESLAPETAGRCQRDFFYLGLKPGGKRRVGFAKLRLDREQGCHAPQLRHAPQRHLLGRDELKFMDSLAGLHHVIPQHSYRHNAETSTSFNVIAKYLERPRIQPLCSQISLAGKSDELNESFAAFLYCERLDIVIFL